MKRLKHDMKARTLHISIERFPSFFRRSQTFLATVNECVEVSQKYPRKQEITKKQYFDKVMVFIHTY